MSVTPDMTTGMQPCPLTLSFGTPHRGAQDDEGENEIDVTGISTTPLKSTRVTMPLAFKMEWIKEYLTQPKGTKQKAFVDTKNIQMGTNVHRSSFSEWYNQYKSGKLLIANCHSERKRLRRRPYSEMEEKLNGQIVSNNATPGISEKMTRSWLRRKGKQLATEVYDEEKSSKFNASSGWTESFLKYYDIGDMNNHHTSLHEKAHGDRSSEPEVKSEEEKRDNGTKENNHEDEDVSADDVEMAIAILETYSEERGSPKFREMVSNMSDVYRKDKRGTLMKSSRRQTLSKRKR